MSELNATTIHPEQAPEVCRFCGGLADLVAGFKVLVCPCGLTVSSLATPILEQESE